MYMMYFVRGVFVVLSTFDVVVIDGRNQLIFGWKTAIFLFILKHIMLYRPYSVYGYEPYKNI